MQWHEESPVNTDEYERVYDVWIRTSIQTKRRLDDVGDSLIVMVPALKQVERLWSSGFLSYREAVNEAARLAQRHNETFFVIERRVLRRKRGGRQ